jgi:hypothetical protein
MEDRLKDNTATNLADLANTLVEARKAIPNSQEKLRDKPKSAESYLICKDGTIAETDHSEHENGRVVVSETKK